MFEGNPPPLPAGFTFHAIGATGPAWHLKTARGITFRTPDGDIEIGVMGGRPYIRSFKMQGTVAAGGPDNVLMIIFGEEPPAPPTPVTQ